MITKKQLLISIIFNGTNTIMLIYYIYDIYLRPIDLEHITRWCYYLNSIFTTLCLICDIFLYYNQIDKENFESEQNYRLMNDNEEKKELFEKLNDWNRNKYGVICNTLSYFVLIGFWSLYFFGNKIMLVNKNVRSWFNCYYHHLLIQIIILIDIFVFDRRRLLFSWKQFGFIFGFYSIYCGIVIVEKYIIGRNAYYFMEGKSFIFLVFCYILSGFILYISYLLHWYFVGFKFNKIRDNRGESEKDACNKLFNSLDNEKCIKFIDESKV